MAFYRVTLPHIGKAEREWIAREIGSHIREQAQLQGVNALDLHDALRRLNIYLAELMTEDAPEAFLHTESDVEMLSTLYIGMRSDNPRYKYAIIHEIAQKLQITWVAMALYDADHVVCTEQDNEMVRHRIAKAVECQFWD